MKSELLERNWYNYLRFWKEEGRDSTNPPTENGFWVWYAKNVMDQPGPDPTTVDL